MEESGRDGFLSFVIANGNYGGASIQRTVGIRHADAILELKRQIGGKQDLSSRAEFNDGSFLQAFASRAHFQDAHGKAHG